MKPKERSTPLLENDVENDVERWTGDERLKQENLELVLTEFIAQLLDGLVSILWDCEIAFIA